MGRKRKVEVNIISAEGLKISSRFGDPRTYAVVSAHPSNKFYTHVDDEGGPNPVWNHKLLISVDNYILEQGSGKLTIEIFHRGRIHDRIIGTVEIPFTEIPQHARFDPETTSPLQYMAFEIRRPSGRSKGILNLSIRLREISRYSSSSDCSSSSSDGERKSSSKVEKLPKVVEPLTAYPPPPPSAAAAGYPPAPSGYPSYSGGSGYNYPPPPSYYNPQQPSYGGYQQAAPYYDSPAAARSGHSNLALGAGIAAGALGGLVLGEVVENIAENAAEEAVEDEDYGDGDDW